MIHIRPFAGHSQRRERSGDQDKKKAEEKRKLLELKAGYLQAFIVKD